MYGSAGYFEFVLSDECRGGVKKKTHPMARWDACVWGDLWVC